VCSRIFLSATEPPEEGVEIGAGLGVAIGTLDFDGRVPGLNIELLLGIELANSGALPPRLAELKRAPLTGRVLNINYNLSLDKNINKDSIHPLSYPSYQTKYCYDD
jgi:hypothetical protein